MADISKIKTPDGDEYNFKDATSRENIQSITDRNDYFEKYLSDMLGFSYITRGYSDTQIGITVETLTDKLKIYGITTAARLIVFLNGDVAIKTTTNSFSKTLDAGTYYIESDISGYSSTYSFRATYTTFADNFTVVSEQNKNATVTFTNPVMIGLNLSNNKNFGTVEEPTYVSFKAQRVAYSDADNTSY